MSATHDPAQGCPKCGGQGGYQFTMTESHLMTGGWGRVPVAGDSGLNVRCSLVECLDCGAKFKAQALEARGALGGDGVADLRDG
ncbi:hypothetical protein IB232_21910 [Pseudomonas sp. PDM15]|uniref:hypothetical protein n=1 Tax=Pseudomonas sp. PDM15 TaxID=2769303 RepID=UPI0017806941|nr:hypothetical protein [Pseudomonas sp. PDM15]MBD9427997.1 hypothetical protein [Pseudomonas sp. PDM15]